ncbi:MAG: chemotaxis protein CheB, partial [Proteobacteria bacterium]|nr:chemotaxis protein CheB [Pseudomonadota bacterium]
DQLIGVILTGANSDGALGLKKIRENGGLSVVQEPESAFSNAMPTSAITVAGADHILSLDKIGPFLTRMSGRIF